MSHKVTSLKAKEFVSIYAQILAKKSILIPTTDRTILEKLVQLAFQLDDVFDVDGSSSDITSIVQEMHKLSQNNSILDFEIDLLLQNHLKELQYIPTNLKHYLEISSENIGADIFSGYIANNYVDLSLWKSRFFRNFNKKVNTILRLANDLIDYDTDKERLLVEKAQIKASTFVKKKKVLKLIIIISLLKHKIEFFFDLLLFQITRKKRYKTLLLIIESTLDLGIRYYFIKKDSLRTKDTISF